MPNCKECLGPVACEKSSNVVLCVCSSLTAELECDLLTVSQ